MIDSTHIYLVYATTPGSGNHIQICRLDVIGSLKIIHHKCLITEIASCGAERAQTFRSVRNGLCINWFAVAAKEYEHDRPPP